MFVLLQFLLWSLCSLQLPNLLITSIYNRSLSAPSSILTHTMPFIWRIKRIMKKLSCFHDGNEEPAKPIIIVSSFYTTLDAIASTFKTVYSHFLTIHLLSWYPNVKTRWSFKNLRAASTEGEACTVQWKSITSSTTRWITISIINDSQGCSHKLPTRVHGARFALWLPKRVVSNHNGHLRKHSKLCQTCRGGTSCRRRLCGNKPGLFQHPCSGRATNNCRILGQ